LKSAFMLMGVNLDEREYGVFQGQAEHPVHERYLDQVRIASKGGLGQLFGIGKELEQIPTQPISIENYIMQFFNEQNATWQIFRPSGPAFQHLVRLELLIGARRNLLAAKLWVARTFVGDPRNASFARDVTSSFLRWALGDLQNQSADRLIANIADMGGAGAIIRAPVSASPKPELTGGYRVRLSGVISTHWLGELGASA
jgi:hypothetical protein